MLSRTELKLLTALRSMKPLHDLETPHLKKLACIATEVEFPAGTVIYREGDRVTVYTVGLGQLFGWSSLFPPRRKTATARSVTPTRSIVIEANRLRDLFETDHTFESVIMRRVTEVVADRVKATRLQLLSLKTHSPDSRE